MWMHIWIYMEFMYYVSVFFAVHMWNPIMYCSRFVCVCIGDKDQKVKNPFRQSPITCIYPPYVEHNIRTHIYTHSIYRSGFGSARHSSVCFLLLLLLLLLLYSDNLCQLYVCIWKGTALHQPRVENSL